MLGVRSVRTSRALLLVAALATALVVACGKKETAPAAKPPVEVSVVTVAPRDTPAVFEYVAQTQSSQASTSRRASPASSTSACTPKAPSSRPARCCSRWTRSRSRRRSTRPRRSAATQPGGAPGREGEPRARQAARRAERAVAEGPRRRARPVRAGGGRRRAGRRPSSRTAQLNLSYTTIRSPVDGVSELRGRRRRHVPQPAERAAHDGLGADADVDQLQRLGERDGAHPRRRAQGPAPAARRRPVRRRDRDGRRQPVPVHRAHHVRRPVVQPADRHVPAARDRRQSGRACCARTSTCARGCRARSGRTRSSCRSAPCSRARRATSSGWSTRTARPSCGRSSSATGTATAGSSRGLAAGDRSSSTAACGSRRARRQGHGLHAAAGLAAAPAPRAGRGDADRPLRERQVDARRRGVRLREASRRHETGIRSTSPASPTQATRGQRRAREARATPSATRCRAASTQRIG